MEANAIKAVETIRRIRDEQHELLKGKTFEEVKAYYRERASHVHERAQELLKDATRRKS